ncbi:MAG: signal peptidase I [Emcibacteraceae bacterium]|nr:signal peptidase I [Emcibacteraceae bacterium]
MNNTWRPKGWIAIILGFFLQPLAFLYVNRAKLFWFYLLIQIIVVIADYIIHQTISEEPYLQYAYLSWLLLIICPIHAYVITRDYDPQQVRMWYSKWWGISSCYIAMMLLIYIIRIFIFQVYSIPSESMKPYLNIGDTVVASKLGHGNYRLWNFQILKTSPWLTPSRSDVIIFQYPPSPETDYVFRVIGMPGDEIVYQNGALQIKQKCLSGVQGCTELVTTSQTKDNIERDDGLISYTEKIGNAEYTILRVPAAIEKEQEEIATYQWVVPDNHYFVLGDHRDNSNDSRYWGFVPEENIVGKVSYIW